MTALERWNTAYAIDGLSVRMSELYDFDRAEDEALSTIPAQRGDDRA